MSLKQYQQKNKFTDQQLADNCGISKEGLIKLRDKRSPKTYYSTIVKVQEATGINGEDLVDGVNALKKLINRIKAK